MADRMRERIVGCAPAIRELGEAITEDAGVVYRPLEAMMVTGAWSKGRVVLLGDAVPATTPHLGQGAGLAIEDALVLAQELERETDVARACISYRDRRYERCSYIVSASLAICYGQLDKGPPVDMHQATAAMVETVAKPI
jgi:2-polyprenyl-6-methoxyphenol hydroxylase-like FAD-dependent oxidoreductase